VLRILAFFIHGYKWGEKVRGDERRFMEIAKEFRKAGMRLYVIEHSPSMQKFYHKTSIYHSLEIPSQSKLKSPLLTALMQMFHTLLFVTRICFKLRHKVDIIYVHNQDVSNLIPAFISKLIMREPLVVVLHSLRDFNLPLKDLLKTYRRTALDGLLIIVHRIVGRRILKIADIIFAVSDTIKREAIKYLGSVRVIVTGNGVDANKFRPLNLEKEYHAVFHGRIDFVQKGIGTLLKAWRVVTNNFPSVKLLLIGGFEDDHNRKLLIEFIEILGLKNNVTVTGFVSDDELIDLLNKSKIFVLPSRFEGFGLSVLEAMSCGLPCIISDIPVFRELHRGIAFLVPQYEIEGFANALLQILNSKREYYRMSSISREHALKFSWSNVAKREMLLLQSISRWFKG